MKTVYLVRHAETTWNAENRVQGVLDLPLSPTGIIQTQKTVALLSGTSFDVIFSSPLARARAIAEPVSHNLGMSTECVPDLREIAFGDWEGHTWNELTALYPETLAAWERHLPDARPDGGESLAEAGVRATKVRTLFESDAGQLLLAVAHGGFNRVLICTLLGVPFSELGRFPQSNASISIFELDQNGWHTVLLDSVTHLT
ncbi:MAG: histidine phosphatase family protein [Candidatus Cryosericum sp.]